MKHMVTTLSTPSAAPRAYYNVSEVAAMLGVSWVSVWRWISSGRLPVARLGHRTVRIRSEDVERITRARTTRAVDEDTRGWQADGQSDHVVMFYEDEPFLFDSVARFIGPALKAGDRGALVASAGHREGIEASLTR